MTAETLKQTDPVGYLSQVGQVATTAEVEAMTDDEFETLLNSTHTRPVIFTGPDPETGEEIQAVCVPISVFNGMIGTITGTYDDMQPRATGGEAK